MRVGQQNGVNGRQIGDPDPGPALPAQQDQPGRKYRVNQQRSACNLNEK